MPRGGKGQDRIIFTLPNYVLTKIQHINYKNNIQKINPSNLQDKDDML